VFARYLVRRVYGAHTEDLISAYKTFPENLYFPFWFREFFRFPLVNIYIFLLKMLNQEELFSDLPYII